MSDITLQKLPSPVAPAGLRNFNELPTNDDKNEGNTKLKTVVVDKNVPLQVLPQARPEMPIQRKSDTGIGDVENATEGERYTIEIESKQREIKTTDEELQDVNARKNELEAQIQKLNSELKQLKNVDAEFKLNKDEDGYYVTLHDKDLVLKELTVDEFKAVSEKASRETMGVILNLFY